MSDLKQTFWDRLSKSRTGMLGATSAPAAPMTHHVDAHNHALWFITAKTTDLGKAADAASKAQYMVANDGEQIYARIDGTLATVNDPEKLDELWSVFAAAWFEDGKRDDDVQLIRLDLSEAEIWSTDGKLSLFYEVAKANLSGGTADAGQHGTIHF